MSTGTPPVHSEAASGEGGLPAGWPSYLLPGLVVLVLLGGLIAIQGQVEAAAAGLAGLLPIGYAFAAGMVAAVNPCGFMLLPSFLSYQLGTEETGFYESHASVRVARGVLHGAVATAGFLLVFGLTGMVIGVGGRWIAAVFPFAGVAVGAGMVALGLWLLLSGKTFGIAAAAGFRVPAGRNLRNVFLFGIAYALGSLGCTLPIFLVVVGSGLAAQDLASSVGQFFSYAIGMGSVLVAVTIGAAVARGALVANLRRLMPHVHRASALFLTGAGLYLLYYWVIFARLFG